MAMVTLSFGGKEVKTYDLSKQAMVIGRDPGADIVIDNLGVSRSHCQLLKRGAAFVVQDMNSANGTYVNGKKVGEHSLNDNDQIVVGKYVLTFKAAGGAGGAPAPAVSRAPAADRIVPDSLNTYMMDGNKIKERIDEMRRDELAKAAPAPAALAPAAPAAPAAAAPSERPSRIVMGAAAGGLSPSTLRLYLYLSLAMNLLLATAFALFYYFYLTHAQS
jgi:pSer/pThr/pTyr-binding forkhead associated (FHA) protein